MKKSNSLIVKQCHYKYNERMGLTAAQTEIVNAPLGPMLVTAGAGSGKTRVLTTRLLHLLQLNIPEKAIVALTFTNKAGNEMRERVEKMLGRPFNTFIGTFHSFCVRLLRKHSGKPNFSIYATADTNKVLKDIIKEMFKEVDSDLYKAATDGLSKWKNTGIVEFTSNHDALVKIFNAYREQLQKNNAYDFDDLLLETLNLLKTNAVLCDKLQNYFQYILVDEFQDTNETQYEIVSLLAQKHRNIMVVGDEDQCIYSWRGASVENINRFQADFPETKIYRLEENFRSSGNIVKLASGLVAKNNNRIAKNLYSNINDGLINYEDYYDDKQEAQGIISHILENRRNGGSWSDSAILMRINALSRRFEEALRMYNIPYVVWGGFKFYERAEVKIVLDYLRLLVNPDDEVSLFNVINFPKRGIGEACHAKIKTYAREHGLTAYQIVSQIEQYDLGLTVKTQNAVQGFAKIVFQLQGLLKQGLIALADELVDVTGLQSHYENEKDDSESRLENIYQLCGAIREYAALNPSADLSSYLQSVTLAGGENPDATDQVVISTIHSAKGLEFKNVYIVGMEDGLFPSYKSQYNDAVLEEERRLLYVAITRAMRNLNITYARARFLNGEISRTIPSSFLMELGYFGTYHEPHSFNW
ncbi:MAG: UvrD-helicase domain-containing protein [Clostridia bacterium]|nr:UvrD-helicase domain-containing protein [Clostridia bacterium]